MDGGPLVPMRPQDSTYPNADGGQGAGIRLYTDWGGVRSTVRCIRNDA